MEIDDSIKNVIELAIKQHSCDIGDFRSRDYSNELSEAIKNCTNRMVKWFPFDTDKTDTWPKEEDLNTVFLCKSLDGCYYECMYLGEGEFVPSKNVEVKVITHYLKFSDIPGPKTYES